jgi:hypothetical protein
MLKSGYILNLKVYIVIELNASPTFFNPAFLWHVLLSLKRFCPDYHGITYIMAEGNSCTQLCSLLAALSLYYYHSAQ